MSPWPGTATLEAAYFGLPYCLVYKVAWPTYLIARMERSVAAARAVVAALDARALALGRPITRGMAADLMGQGAELTGHDLDSDGPG